MKIYQLLALPMILIPGLVGASLHPGDTAKSDLALLSREIPIGKVVPIVELAAAFKEGGRLRMDDIELVYVDEAILRKKGMAVLLQEIMDSGVPALLVTSPLYEKDGTITRALGVRPNGRYSVVQRTAQGRLEVFGFEAERLEQIAPAVALVVEWQGKKYLRRQPDAVASVGRMAPLTDPIPSIAPAIEINFNLISEDGQVNAASSLKIVRNTSQSSRDVKTISVKNRSNIVPKLAGTTNGTETGKNLWGAYLPTAYAMSHTLTTPGVGRSQLASATRELN